MSCRYKMTIAYDGYDYAGFQAQSGYKTIEDELNKAFQLWLGQTIKITASGRTDKEVSAWGQVVHFDLTNFIEPAGIMRALNSFLPLAIRVKKIVKVSGSFHARFSAQKKEYRYYINPNLEDTRFYRQAPSFKALDFEAIKQALDLLVGTHNFKGFASAQIDSRKDTVKTIYEASLHRSGSLYYLKFVGSGFLKYQIRRMVGALIDIGYHKHSPDFISLVLEKADPKLSHRIVPGRGLVLVKVMY